MSHSVEADEQERKLYIGGLNKDSTDEEEIRQYFEKYGKIVDVTVMRDQERRSRGFGFVLFEEASYIDKIMKAKRDGADFVLSNYSVHLKRALPKVPGGRAVAPRADSRKVFVGGLPNTITEEDLQTYFEEFGQVNQVELLRERETNRLRGFAFVTFEEEDTADRCMQRRSHEICKKMCEVKRATTKSREGQGGRSGGNENQGSRHQNQPISNSSASGGLPIEEVNRLIQQAFIMGQQSAQARVPTAASLLGGVSAPAPAGNNALLQALLSQQGLQAPAPSLPVSAPSPAPTAQLAQLLQSGGLDANTLANLLKGDSQHSSQSKAPTGFSTSYPPASNYNYSYEDKSGKYGSNNDDHSRRYNPY